MWKFIKSLLVQIAPSLGSSAGAGLLSQIFGLTRAEKQQNQFNAFEAQKNRDFQAEQVVNQNAFAASEAQLNRDFQADQAATQYQRGVKDMQTAGLNPALAYGQGGASAMSGAMAAAPAPASGSAASGNGRGLAMSLSDLMQMAKTKADIDEAQSRIKLNESQGGLFDAEREYKGLEIAFFQPLTEGKLKQIESSLQNDAVERDLKRSGITVNEAQAALLDKNTLLAGIDAQTRGYLNNLEARLRVAQIGLTYAETSKAREEVNKLKAEETELLQRAVTEAAQAGLYDQQALNLLTENGILQYDKDTKQYLASKKELTYTLDCIGKVVGAVGSAVSMGASVATGLGALRGAGALSGMSGLMKGAGLHYAPANSFNPYVLAR